jgi:hypothetical protein
VLDIRGWAVAGPLLIVAALDNVARAPGSSQFQPLPRSSPW